jgi:hypothetical protein
MAFAGYNDWRVPNMKELVSILDFENASPAVSSAFNNACAGGCTVLTCSCTGAAYYWSSTTYMPTPFGAEMVNFTDGNVAATNKGASVELVRAVRAGSCLPATGQTTSFVAGDDGDIRAGTPLSYTDNGDGTITDNNTGLVWEKHSADGGIHDQNNTYTWGDGFAMHVAGLNTTNFAGHNDWRVPNVKELQSIIDYQNIFPAVSSAFNNGCTGGCTVLTCSCAQGVNFWSSSTYATTPSLGETVFFGNGALGGVFTKSTPNASRAVRGGS